MWVLCAEIMWWALVGAVVPLGVVVLRANTQYRGQGLMGAPVIPAMAAPMSALCGAAAFLLVSSQTLRMVLAVLVNGIVSVYMFW